MSIKRFAGSHVQMPVPFTVSTSDPLDERLVVDSFSAITSVDTFKNTATGSKVYEGMQVYVIDEQTTYMYVGPYVEGDGVTNADAIVASNWRKVSDPQSSVDKIQDNLNKLAQAAGVSGTATADTFGYSAHTEPSFISDQSPVSIQTEVIAVEKALTPTTNTDEKVTGTTAGDAIHNNIISITKDGIEAFADLHYNSTSNKLTFVNTNGKKDIELTGVNFISAATYDKSTEQIKIYYKKYGETTASTLTIDVKDLIEEYDFKYAESGGTEYNKDLTVADHNVSLKWTRSISGTTAVYGDIDVFDCGTY